MRKAGVEIKIIIERIKQMKGNTYQKEVNKGRKKIEKYVGVVEDTYPSVFTVDVFEPENKGKQSFSYSDVLCGDVVFRKMIKSAQDEELVDKKQLS